MPNKVRILLADDHAVVREGLKALLNGEPDLEVVGEARDGAAAVELAVALDPDLVVLDVSMPGLNGVAAAEQIHRANPTRKIVALSVHEDRGYLRMMLAAGAAGYVLKRSAADELLRAVRAVTAGQTYLDPALADGLRDELLDRVADGAAGGELSQREQEVLKLIAEGFSNKEIASNLNLSVKTVETYKTRSLEKLGLRTRVDVVRYALRRGWLKDPV
ncbi:response regulator [Limnoglobus roseus]|uniref:DNA-binding response regulator n=1 Tax=Limnoglobus roseus TaxID=2598579 RepID=A0A5C1AG56_9BACT|nr:response regulator transcription factor [Limnoglobus roseus]QEL17615.1 DNA-binding response regulator [Limnoglobus roseus]